MTRANLIPLPQTDLSCSSSFFGPLLGLTVRKSPGRRVLQDDFLTFFLIPALEIMTNYQSALYEIIKKLVK